MCLVPRLAILEPNAGLWWLKIIYKTLALAIVLKYVCDCEAIITEINDIEVIEEDTGNLNDKITPIVLFKYVYNTVTAYVASCPTMGV